jgi:hypothetical protein
MPYGQLNVDSVVNSDGVTSGGLYGFKNRIINGAMMIDQRNAGASVTPTTDNTYTLDRWSARLSAASKYSVQQNAGAATPPTGFSKYLGATSLAATSLGSTDFYYLSQAIEGFNTADLGWGAAGAQSVTLSFWVRSSLTGTFGGALSNSTQGYCYPFSYSIAAANTWTQISVTIAGPTAGTWIGATNATGILVAFGMGVGSTYSGTAGSWSANTYASSTGATSVVGTNGATFYITGVQLEKGSTATSFDYRPYGTELTLCQRYYWKNDSTANYAALASGVAQTTTSARVYMKYPAEMRTQPSMSYNGSITVNDSGDRNITAIGAAYTSTSSVMLDLNVTTVLTVGRGVVVYKGNSSSDYIQASAEL